LHHLGCVFDGKGEDGEDWREVCEEEKEEAERKK
jgi:hypothetical protein